MINLTLAKRELISLLRHNENVVGGGIGYATKCNQVTREIAIIIFVGKKLPLSRVELQARIPSAFHSYRVDVVERPRQLSRGCCGRGH